MQAPYERVKELEGICENLLSESTPIRQVAEEAYLKWRSEAVDHLVLTFRLLLRLSSAPNIRAASLVLLRLIFTHEKEWDKVISPHTRQLLCSELLVCLSTETNFRTRRNLVQLVSYVGRRLHVKGEWKELVPYLHMNFRTQSTDKKRSMLVLMRDIVLSQRRPPPVFYIHLNDILVSGFSDVDPQIRYSTFLSACEFFHRMLMKPQSIIAENLIPHIHKTAREVLRSSNEQRIQKTVEWMWKLVVDADEYFCPEHFDEEFMTSLYRICRVASDVNTKLSVCDFILQMCESDIEIIALIPKWPEFSVKFAFELLVDVDESIEIWSKTISDHSGEIYCYHGEVLLDRLSLLLGGDAIFPALNAIVMSYAQSTDWRKKMAAVQSLGVAAEGCRDAMGPHLEFILNNVVKFANDPHPRVRWAAIYSIALLSDIFKEEFQEIYHTVVLDLLKILHTDPHALVREHAADALVNVVSDAQEGCNMEGHFSYMVDILRLHLRENRCAITALEVLGPFIAQKQKKAKTKAILQELMVYLQELHLRKDDDVVARDAWGRVVRCIAVIGERSKSKVVDWHLLMSIATTEKLGEKDELLCYLVQMNEHAAKILKKEYSKYLPLVVPGFLDLISFRLLDKPPVKEGEKERYVAVNPEEIEPDNTEKEDLNLKEDAFRILCEMIDATKDEFYEFIEPVQQMCFALAHGFIDNMKAYSAECLTCLIGCLIKYAKKTDPTKKEEIKPFALKSI